MIVVGVAIALLAFAGSALGDDSEGSPSGWDCVLYILLLLGIVLKQRKAKDDEEF